MEHCRYHLSSISRLLLGLVSAVVACQMTLMVYHLQTQPIPNLSSPVRMSPSSSESSCEVLLSVSFVRLRSQRLASLLSSLRESAAAPSQSRTVSLLPGHQTSQSRTEITTFHARFPLGPSVCRSLLNQDGK